MKTFLCSFAIWPALLALCACSCRKPDSRDRPGQDGFLKTGAALRPAGGYNGTSLQDYHPRFDVFLLPGTPEANKVNVITQDAAGFLWFGSEWGLHRYDGSRFETFRYNSDVGNLRNGDMITAIHIDAQGILWYGSSKYGLTSFNPASGKVTRFLHNSADSSSLCCDQVIDVKEDRQGRLWLATFHGLSRFDKKTGRFKNFYARAGVSNSLSDNFVQTLLIDRQGTLWAGCGAPDGGHKINAPGGLNRYIPSSETFARYLYRDGQPGGLADNQVTAIFEDSRGVFYVGTAKGVQLFDRQSQNFDGLRLPSGSFETPGAVALNGRPDTSGPYNISFIREDSGGHIWIGDSSKGLTVYDPATGITRHFSAGSPGLAFNSVAGFFQSRDGVVWLTTGQNGGTVYQLKPMGALFSSLSFEQLGVDKSAQITDMLEDRRGYLWYGFKNNRCALLRYDPNSGQKLYYLNNGNPAALNTVKLNQLMEDRDGYIWASTWSGLFKIDPVSGKIKNHFINHPNDSAGPAFVRARDILEDRNGDIWVATYFLGVDRYERRTGKFYHYVHDSADVGSIASNKSLSLCLDLKGNIIVGCGAASDTLEPLVIDRFNLQTGKFERLAPAGATGWAPKMSADDRGNIWFNNFQGLGKLQTESGKLQTYTTASFAIPRAREFFSVIAGKNGSVWLTTGHDVVEYNSLNDSFYRYDKYVGIQFDTLDIQAAYLSRRGEYFFGGKGGSQSFFTDKMIRPAGKQAPDLQIAGFRVDGKPVIPGPESPLREPVWQATEARLRAGQDVFSIAVANFDFRNPGANTLEFKLEPYDSAWRRDLRDGEAAYARVPAGKYIFRLRGTNSDGVAGEKTLAITVASPVWASLWFLALVAAFFSLAAWQATRYFAGKKLRAQALELEKERTLQKERDRIAAELHDDMGSGLSLIRLLSEQASERAASEEQKWRADKIAAQARELVENMSTIIWAMNSRNDTAAGLVAFLRRYAFEYADTNDLACRFPAPPAIPGLFVRGEVRRSIFLAFKEALHNVVKHANAGSVEINAAFEGGRLKIILRDDGKGFQAVSASAARPAAGGAFAGTGLLNMERRMTALGGSFYINSAPGLGTSVALEAPLPQD